MYFYYEISSDQIATRYNTLLQEEEESRPYATQAQLNALNTRLADLFEWGYEQHQDELVGASAPWGYPD
jgi:hypothetical protein